jgi:hypothetical protein
VSDDVPEQTFFFIVNDTVIENQVFYSWMDSDCDVNYLFPLNRSFKAVTPSFSQEVEVGFYKIELKSTTKNSSYGGIRATSIANVIVDFEASATMDLTISGNMYNYSVTEEGVIDFHRVSGDLFQTVASGGSYNDQYQLIFYAENFFIELS